MSTLVSDDVVKAVTDAVACDFDDGVAILNLASGTYFSVNAVGASVWEIIQSPVRVSEVCAAISDSYEVDVDTCCRDVEHLLADMKQNGLVVIHVAEAA